MSIDIDSAACLNVLEFVLEGVVANNFALREQGRAELSVFKDQLIERISRRSTRVPGMQDRVFIDLKTKSAEIAARFFERTEERRAEIERQMFG